MINAPGGIPIVGNSGTINNPVVNNFSPPKRQLTDSQITSLSEIANEIPDGQTIDMITDNTQESANYGRAIHDALNRAGAKLKSGPLFSMIPMSSLPNGPVGTVVCVSNYSDPTMPLAKKIAEVLVQNTPVKLLQCAGFDRTNVRIVIAEP